MRTEKATKRNRRWKTFCIGVGMDLLRHCSEGQIIRRVLERFVDTSNQAVSEDLASENGLKRSAMFRARSARHDSTNKEELT